MVTSTSTRTAYTDAQRAFLEKHFVCTVATVNSAGEPFQSTTLYVMDGDDIVVSTMGARLKAKHVDRSGRASVSVHGTEQPFPEVVVAGPARVERDDIVSLSNRIAKLTHFAKDVEFDAEILRRMDRVLLRVTPERVHSQYIK